MANLLSWGRQLIELVLGFWKRVSVPEYQTWRFQRNQWIQRISPNLVVDVGANTGQWARDYRESFPNLGYLVSFEPDGRAWDEYRKNLGSFQAHLVPCAAGSTDGTSELYEWSLEGGSSSLKSLTGQGELITNQTQHELKEAKVPVVRLDKYLLELFDDLHEKVLYLKIDVQGGELDVLDGIQDIISLVGAIEIEIPLLMVYEGGSSPLEILRKLNSWGFTMLSAQTERWNSERMLAADFDALFIKTDTLNSYLGNTQQNE